MESVISQFRNNVERVRSLHAIFVTLDSQTTTAVNLSDILRAELVLIVSALDCYIHGVVKMGMLEVFQGSGLETSSFKKFSISLEQVRNAINYPSDFEWLESEIISRHSWRSFQQADKIAEAIALISSKKLWSEVADQWAKTAEDIKIQLNVIVDRRNKIAHEADTDPSYAGSAGLWPIDAHTTLEAMNFIAELVEVIHCVINDEIWDAGE